MLKKCVIFIFIATAYSVLLAHNLTPHQHDTKQTTHHHDHGHQHDHDDDQESDTGTNAFHFFQHIGATEIQYTSGQFVKYDIQKIACEVAFIKAASFILSHFEKPPLIVPLLRAEHFSFPQTLPYFFHLKAPPAAFNA